MRKLDYTVVVIAVLAAVAYLFVESDAGARFLGLFVIVGTASSLIALGHGIDRPPKLVIEYRNPKHANRAVVPRQGIASLVVTVRNKGRGTARTVEVLFDPLPGCRLYNESGNLPNPLYLDPTVHPPRFTGQGRILGPGEEWNIALLSANREFSTLPGPASWEARAEGMARQRGTVQFSWSDQDASG